MPLKRRRPSSFSDAVPGVDALITVLQYTLMNLYKAMWHHLLLPDY